MKTIIFAIITALGISFNTSLQESANIWGDIEIVTSGEDYKVQKVTHGEDYQVKVIETKPWRKGQWRIVDWGAKYKIRYVDHDPDFTIRLVDNL